MRRLRVPDLPAKLPRNADQDTWLAGRVHWARLWARLWLGSGLGSGLGA